ncbi:phage integrase SAM-like domain-containing protein [Bacteroides thetaiotaomicron]|uniref:site-specific integrase n=1 Tax=Bacteroides thetaiotaomicron TaxID=818 RepID=UPI0034BC1EA8
METKDKQETTHSGSEKRRSTFAILFYINRTKIRKDGMCQLLCKVSIDAESQQIGTKVSVDPSLWSPSEGRATGRSRNALEVNKAIELLTERIENHHREIRSNLGFVTAELVKNALKGIAQKPLTLMKLFEEHNAEFKLRIGVDRKKEAYESYVNSYNHLSAFLQKKFDTDDVTLRSLNRDFFDAYDLFLRTDRGMMQKTVHQHTYILKKMTKRAVSQGTLRRDPYHNIHPALPPLKSRHLKIEELERLMQCRIEATNLQRVRDWFVFSTFTGLCYADLRNLSDEHITQAEDGSQWIHIKRQKTGTDSRIRLMDIPLRIIEKYRPERKGKRIFNIYTRTYFCKLVRKMGKLCGIDVINFHKARHCFGTHITLSQGVPIETVSRMMGHKSITTTQIYAKVTDKKIDEDMKRLKQRTAGNKVSLYEDEALRAAIRFPRENKKSKDVQPTNSL